MGKFIVFKAYFYALVALNRNLDKNRKSNKVYISNQGASLWQKKTKKKLRSVAA